MSGEVQSLEPKAQSAPIKPAYVEEDKELVNSKPFVVGFIQALFDSKVKAYHEEKIRRKQEEEQKK